MKNSTSESAERLKIARDLHDTLAQEIAAIGFSCDEAVALAPLGAARTSLLEIRSRLSLLSTIVRDEIALLRDEHRSFGDLLRDFVHEVAATTEITITNGIAGDFSLNGSQNIELFRATREILTNILAHSGASMITISATSPGPRFGVLITDDGMDHEMATRERSHHFGSLGAQERVASLGGTLEFFRENSRNHYQLTIW